MANVDNPRGFTPVRSLDQNGLVGKIQSYVVAAATTVAIGDPVGLTDGLVVKAATGVAVLGVVVGVGNESAITFGGTDGLFNPDDLTRVYASTGESVSVILANNVVFRGQTATAQAGVVKGVSLDINATQFVDATHNRSQVELVTNVNGDAIVTGWPEYNSAAGAVNSTNVPTDAYAELDFIFSSVVFGQS